MSITPVSIEVVADPARFAALKPAWAALVKQSRQYTLFLQWEWLHTWWQVFAEDNMRLQILLIKSGDELVGIAPFYMQLTGFPRGAILRFIGTGELEQDQVLSEYLDVFALPDFESLTVNAVSDWISANGQWRQLRFDDVLGDALCLQLSQKLNQYASQDNRVSGFRYFISLPDSFDAYLQRLSSSRRSRYKRCRKALVKDGADPNSRTIPSASGVDEQMQRLRSLNHERWSGKAGQGVFESPRFMQFHLQVCRLLWSAKQADIKILAIADKPIAALYVFYADTVCHYYQSGFTAEGANRYMPLFVSHLNEIEVCISRNLKRYDFMRGAADSYKKDYACESEPMYTFRLWRHAPEHNLSKCKRRLAVLVKSCLSRIPGK